MTQNTALASSLYLPWTHRGEDENRAPVTAQYPVPAPFVSVPCNYSLWSSLPGSGQAVGLLLSLAPTLAQNLACSRCSTKIGSFLLFSPEVGLAAYALILQV